MHKKQRKNIKKVNLKLLVNLPFLFFVSILFITPVFYQAYAATIVDDNIYTGGVLTVMGNTGIGTTSLINRLNIDGVNNGSAGIYINNAVPLIITNTLYNQSGKLRWDNTTLVLMASSTSATASGSVAIGANTTASGVNALAIGSNTIASGLNSVAMGENTSVSGRDAFVAGYNVIASGANSISTGSSTAASGVNASAMGEGTSASGRNAFTIGANNIASGDNSVAIGANTIAQAYKSFAAGQYNVGGGNSLNWVAVDPLFEIGIGTSGTNKANALTVLKNGNIGISTTTPAQLFTVGNNNQFTITSSGNTGIAGTLGVTGATTLANTLGVIGATILANTLTVSGTGDSSIMGNLGVGITNPAGYKLNVNGTVYFADNVTLAPSKTVDGVNLDNAVVTTGSYSDPAWLTISKSKVGLNDAVLTTGSYSDPAWITSLSKSKVGLSNVENTALSSWPGSASISTLGTISGNLNVGGDVTASAFYYSSDRSLKKNIKTIDNALDKVSQLRGVSFNWKSNDKLNDGLIAQEVEKVLPELVQINPATGLKSVSYANVVSILIEAVKELDQKYSTEIQTLKLENKNLNQKIIDKK